MTTVDFELTRLYQAQRQEEAATDRLVRQARAGRRGGPAWFWCLLPYGAHRESMMRATLDVQDATESARSRRWARRQLCARRQAAPAG
jgi:hypothetical protein